MSIMQPQELATYLKSKKNILLLTGALCDEVDFDGKTLMDYAAELAKKLNLPVAAPVLAVKGTKPGHQKKLCAAAQYTEFFTASFDN